MSDKIVDQIPVLHIYGQKSHHGAAWLVGNRAGLKAIASGINEVLETGLPTSREAFVADGEAYEVYVHQDDSDWTGPRWQQLLLPYTQDWIVNAERERLATHPADAI